LKPDFEAHNEEEEEGSGFDSMLPADLPVLEEEGLAEGSEVETATQLESRRALAESLLDKPPESAMLRSVRRLLGFIGNLLFAHVLFEQRSIDSIRDASKRGDVVYVMKTTSLLDYLYFNYAFLKHDLPLARFANGMNIRFVQGFFAWLAGLFTRRRKEKPEIQMEALVNHGEAVFIFLEKPRQEPDEAIAFSQKYLYRLVRAQKNSPRPVYVIPLLLIWEKRPDSRRASFLGDIFGTVQSPGFFRKLVNYFQTIWQSFVRFGQPIVQVSSSINIQEFLREYPNAGSSEASELLRERLDEHITRERQVILGPEAVPKESIFKDLMTRPELVSKIREVAEKEGVSEEKIRKRARAQLEEIAAEPSMLMIKIFNSVLSLVWYRIYDGFEVDEEGIDKVRDAARSGTLVLIPSHKSHIDYLIISYIFYQYGLMTPHIAAGANLSFWPMGWIFRRAGAFFLRRSFKGDELYPVMFREYLIHLMQHSHPIEFFIEGTRSRTGKLIKPRYGMLDMMIRAYAHGRLESVKIVPISVGYEKIIEEQSFRQELLGEEKQKESLAGLLKTPKFLTSKYGRLYVEFDTPIDLEEYMEKYGVERLRPDDREIDELTVRLAHRIIYDINRVTTVSPSALAATVLLNNSVRGTDRERFLREVGFVLRFLTQPERSARLSATLGDALDAREAALLSFEPCPDGKKTSLSRIAGNDDGTCASVERAMGEAVASVMDRALSIFESNKQVRITRDAGEVFYATEDDARLELAFYRNTLVHHFVPEGLLATAILRFQSPSIDLDELMAETLFLSRLFKYEWIYEERAEFENVFARTLDYFEDMGFVDVVFVEEGGRIEVVRPSTELEYFRRIVLTFLEAYVIVANLLDDVKDTPMEEGALIKEALKRGRADFLRGEIHFFESLSKPTFKNALRLLVDWGVLEKKVESGRKRDTIAYQIGPDWREADRYKELQQKLEDFVYLEQD
jgi:glycerol-3-phosphate O-acyltransferase